MYPITDSNLGLDRYRYQPILANNGGYRYLSVGTDTSRPVIRLPVSTVNPVARMPIVSSLYRTKNNACTVVVLL